MSLKTFLNSGLFKQKSKNLISLGFNFENDPKEEYLKIQSLLYSEYHIRLESTLYETECLRIKYFDTQKSKFRIAVPDFYIPSTNTIVEIKSSYWLDEVNLADRCMEFEKMGFKFQLVLDGELVGLQGNDPCSPG